jgi:hypothetical protein
MANSSLFYNAHRANFYIPRGRFYLADAGFASSDALLVPYQNVWYHLSEWNRAKDAYMVYLLSKYLTNVLMYFQVHAIPRSCSTYIMCQLAILLSKSLGSSSGTF